MALKVSLAILVHLVNQANGVFLDFLVMRANEDRLDPTVWSVFKVFLVSAASKALLVSMAKKAKKARTAKKVMLDLLEILVFLDMPVIKARLVNQALKDK